MAVLILKLKWLKRMLFVSHPVADIINEGHTINNECVNKIIKVDTKKVV